MIRNLTALMLTCLFLVAACPCEGRTENISGVWEVSYFLNKIVVHVENQGEALEGILYLHTPSGETNTYHFSGSLSGGRVEAKHHSGHAFEGNLVEPDTLVGTLTTKTGMRLPIHISGLHRLP